jgi:hypothetical protein
LVPGHGRPLLHFRSRQSVSATHMSVRAHSAPANFRIVSGDVGYGPDTR